MRYFPFLTAMLFLTMAAHAQPFVYAEAVRITDPSGLTDTLNWKPGMRAELIAALGQAEGEKIVRNAVPAAWPAGIATAEARLRNQTQFAQYLAFYITTIHGHLVLLRVPVIENSYMQADMRPATDIYFVVQLQAIASKKSLDLAAAPDFAKDMDLLTRDYKNNFANLTTADVQEAMDGMPRLTGCSAGLQGAYQLYFYEDILLGDRLALRAAFMGSHTEPDSAYARYQELIDQVESLTLGCCPLSKQTESVTGRARSQSFEVFDRHGDLDPAYENMIISVDIEAIEVFSDTGEFVQEWEPVLYIYKK